jgi:hypothetical protein
MSRTMTRPVVKTAAFALLALTALALTLWWTLGRHNETGAEVRRPGIGARLATPDVVWPDGTPRGKHEDTEWAQAVRQWDLAYAVAYNTRDASDATFAQLSSTTLRQGLVDTLMRRIDLGGAFYQIGPRVISVTAIDEAEDGASATVTACEYIGGWDASKATEAAERITEGIDPSATGSAVDYTVERQSDDTLRVTERRYRRPGGGCDLDDARIAYFDPAPPYDTRTQPWEVIGIDGLPLVDPPATAPTSTDQ